MCRTTRLPNGYDWDGLYFTLNAQNLQRWFIQPNPMFEDIVSDAIIYDAACNTRTVVVVGEKGRMAYGIHAKRLKRVQKQPFADIPVIGVACGSDPEGADLFVAVDTTQQYALSRDGETWSDAAMIPGADIEGIMYGGGRFLIWCKSGYIYRSTWVDGELTFLPMSTSPLDTTGLHSIVFRNGVYVGVGVEGKIVSSIDGDGWELETAPDGTPTLHKVFAGNAEFVAVGVGGTILISSNGKSWQKQTSGRKEDFYTGCYYDGVYLVAGKGGTVIASQGLAKGWSAPYTTNMDAIIRVAFRHNGVFVLGNDSGQIATSATFAEILGMIFETDTLSPSNDLPLPLFRYADPGVSLKYARGDHVHPSDGLLTTDKVGVPDGVAPLGPDNKVPSEHLPPVDVNVIIEGFKANLEFAAVVSPFPLGPLQSSILHAGASVDDMIVLVGEAGIGVSNGGARWNMAESQPFDRPVIGVAAGLDLDNAPLVVAIDTDKSFAISRNGSKWSEKITLGGDYDFSWINYYNRTWVITCTNGPILRSIWDGETLRFLEQDEGPEFTFGLNRIVGGNGHWIGVGNGGMIRASTDANHFTPVESPTTKNLYCLTHGKTYFMAGGQSGTLIYRDGDGPWKTAAQPFGGDADIMGMAYITGIGMFVVTNRLGELAVSEAPDLPWSKLTKGSTVAIRAMATNENVIVIGNDRGEISVSKKVLSLPASVDGRGGNVSIGRRIGLEENGLTIGRLIDRNGVASGTYKRNVIMLRPGPIKFEAVQVEI